jgi:hypothetical protein
LSQIAIFTSLSLDIQPTVLFAGGFCSRYFLWDCMRGRERLTVQMIARLGAAAWPMSENQRAFAIADAPPKLVMLALSDLLQEHLTRLVMVEPDRKQTPLTETGAARTPGARSSGGCRKTL